MQANKGQKLDVMSRSNMPLDEMKIVDRKGATVELSAKTPALSVTKHQLGKPGGPGLYHLKGESLDPYIENIAAKLMKVNPGWDKSHAIAVAINMVKRLAATSKHAEVKAAAAKALASLQKSQAKAKATPNLSNAVELANTRNGKVYHWKHGWIPIDHPAAKEAKSHSDTLIKRAETMHGTDRSKWSVVNLKAAVKHGDTRAAVALAKRKKETNLSNSVELAAGVGSSRTLKAEKYTARHGTNFEKQRALKRLKARGAIGNSGDFNSKHPRAQKGSATGGQFVAMGKATDQAKANKSGSQGVAARTEYKDAITGKSDLTKLDDRKLGLLSRAAYSFKSSNPKVVALRNKISAELKRRGYNVRNYGAAGKAPAKPKKMKLSNEVDPQLLAMHRKLVASGVRPEVAMKMAVKARNKKRKAKSNLAFELPEPNKGSPKSQPQGNKARSSRVRARAPKGNPRGGQFVATTGKGN